MTPRNSYDGPAKGIDCSWQHFHERPAAQDDAGDPDEEDVDEAEDEDDVDGETIYATDPEPPGTEETVDVPVPETADEADRGVQEPPDGAGPTTFDDWRGGSA